MSRGAGRAGTGDARPGAAVYPERRASARARPRAWRPARKRPGAARDARGRLPEADGPRADRHVTGALRIVQRNALVYRRKWRGSLFFSFLQPTLFLTAMGVGLGSQIDQAAAA